MRDMTGLGRNALKLLWPNGSHIAINFVVNYEEGAERTPINGDRYSETYGGEFPLSVKPEGMRDLSMESLFEYGSRCGIWRLIRLLDENAIPMTFFATGFALTLNQPLCDYLRASNHDIAGHGWRWVDYALMERKEEKEHIQQCIREIKKATGKRIEGWYTGRRSINTRMLLQEIGGFIYDSDSYADDLPYFEQDHLIIPYTLDCNDFRFTTSPGFSTTHDFYTHLKDTFDYLNHEKRLALMTIGLHPRISGRPGRCLALQRFIHHIQSFQNVWITRRIDVAQFWLNHFRAN